MIFCVNLSRTGFLDANGQNCSDFMNSTLKMRHFWVGKMIVFCHFYLNKTDSSSWILPELSVFHGTGMEDIGCESGEDCSDMNGDMDVLMPILGLFEKWLYLLFCYNLFGNVTLVLKLKRLSDRNLKWHLSL